MEKQTWTRDDIRESFFKLMSDTYDWWTDEKNAQLAGSYLQGIFDLRSYLEGMTDEGKG